MVVAGWDCRLVIHIVKEGIGCQVCPIHQSLSSRGRLTTSSTTVDSGDSNLTFTDIGEGLEPGEPNLIGGKR